MLLCQSHDKNISLLTNNIFKMSQRNLIQFLYFLRKILVICCQLLEVAVR